LGHYIADFPELKNKEKDEKSFKEKSKDYRKKYQCHAHIGQEWESSLKDSDQEGMTTLAIPRSSRKLFNNISNDEADTPFCLMERENKVQESSTSSSQPSSISNNAQNDLEDEEEQHRAYMIKEFGRKDLKKLKSLWRNWRKRKSASIGKKTCSSLKRRETLH
jgi:hypothetical protein